VNELDKDERAHLTLSEKLIGEAEGAADSTRSDRLYSMALEECDKAIGLARYDAGALNSCGYLPWQWYWSWIRGESAEGPTSAALGTAVDRAKTAVRLTEDKGSFRDHQVYESTLGEVQLASGQFDGALKTLEGIQNLGKQALFDEIRWDLAQASVCASSKNDKQATEELKVIRDHENAREDQRFFGETTIEELKSNCHKLGASPGETTLH